MRPLIQNFLKSLLLCSSFLYLGCFDIIDCIGGAKPELENKMLVSGRQGEEYYESILASIDNDPYDNDYYYDFHFYGDLPEGLNYEVYGRYFEIFGVPSERGTFHFSITLEVDAPEIEYDEEDIWSDGDRLCFGRDTITEDFFITIY
ncbi:hypothetical protein ACFQ1M_00510 [Sungkyunkwania multivorans]|uniref:Lipoprotein n=1 Tax=Sungkyunkwania multivorans TaxID=1173618 RepID=A0ABW3CVG3_9FLAO